MARRNWLLIVFSPLALFATCLAACLGTCLAPIVLPILYNKWQLNVFASHLFDYPLPPRTVLIARHASVGLEGNGNHCDFRAEQEMLTSLNESDIAAYDCNVKLPPVNNHNEGLEPWAQGQPIPIFVDIAPGTGSDHRVTISLIDFGYNAGLDLRCD